ncbi:MAG: T9SS type A sorting domain-containing protein [Melioribacteraceae bacterium]|nr:T9SS type A sorting domain-containing protein [Melioribacteraceae bacterium]
MKQKTTILLFALVLAGLFTNLNAQSYLDVPPDPDFAKNYLNNVIYGDTSATGERVADRVYRLEVGGIYYFNNSIITDGWDLRIEGAGEPVGGFSKAIILTGKNDDGGKPAEFAQVTGDVSIKNLYFSAIDDLDRPLNHLIMCYKDGAILEAENIYTEWVKLHVFRFYGLNSTLRATDSYFNNTTFKSGIFNGRLVGFEDLPVKEYFVQNCTVMNMQGIMLKGRFNTIEKVTFDHNTIINQAKWPFHYEYWTDGEVTNNVFFNASLMGENDQDASTQDSEGLDFGIINVVDVPDSILSQVGMSSQGERKLEVRNNLFYFDESVQDYLARYWESDSVRQAPWMNERTKAMFDDDAAYPYFNNEMPLTENPELVHYPTADSMIKKVTEFRAGNNKHWGFVDIDDVKISNPTDRPWDLSYSTSSASYTAADNDLPLGDLNWFPEKKNDWITDVKDIATDVLPSNYVLEQNYPNPFNPATTIKFAIPEAGAVKLSVYNLLGQEVAVLVNGEMNAGSYSVDFNSAEFNLASGMYVYRMATSAQVLTKKLVLLK